MKKAILALLPLAIITVIFGTVYATVQQAQRSGANSPQVQMAEDTAALLDQGAEPHSVVVSNKVDMATSLAPFTIIYDKAGHAIAGSGYINDKMPVIPKGVLLASKGEAYHAITWQPQANVRIASVTVAAKDYFIMSGRSLREVESQETGTLEVASLGWLVAVVLYAIYYVLKPKDRATSWPIM